VWVSDHFARKTTFIILCRFPAWAPLGYDCGLFGDSTIKAYHASYSSTFRVLVFKSLILALRLSKLFFLGISQGRPSARHSYSSKDRICLEIVLDSAWILISRFELEFGIYGDQSREVRLIQDGLLASEESSLL